MEEETKEKQQSPPITFEELKLRLYHPPPSNPRLFGGVVIANDGSSTIAHSLSYIPWTLRQSATNATTSEDASFPTTSYLDLRRQQNRAWANDRLLKGNEQFYLDPINADSLYQEGLDLVPDHIELLVAQAKLWMQRRNRPQAAKAQLQQCLQLDPDHKAAKELLDRLERLDASRRGVAPKRLQQTTLESSSAFQDALMERNLAMDTSLLDAEDELDEHSAASSGRKDAKKKKKKKRKSKKKSKHRKKHDKKRRRKRKRYDDSSTDDSSSSSDESDVDSLEDNNSDRNGSTGKRRERDRKHKRKRRRRRHDSDISGSDSGVDVEPTSSPCIRDDDRNGDTEDGSKQHNRQEYSNHKSNNKHKKRSRKDSQDEMSLSDHESKKGDHKDDEKIQQQKSFTGS
jgi:hypothetical protein